MGNIERLIVLTVLLLTAVVLAVSLRRDGDESTTGAPLDDARRTIAERIGASDGAAAAGEPTLASELQPSRADNPRGAAGSEVDRAAPRDLGRASPTSPNPNGARFPTLRDRSELRPTSLSDLMAYTAKPGDTWQALALRFYGDAQYESVLRAANEGLAVPPAGQDLLVPMYDAAAIASARAPLAAVLDAAAAPGAAGTRAAPGAPDGSGARLHEVKPGETLSSIAKAELGSAARWKEIAALNSDVLADPDQIKVGMRLRLP
jgi:nucleoid-associated protein YgaU